MIEFSPIETGDRGIYQTLVRMRRELEQATRDPRLVMLARELVADAPPFDHDAQARAIHGWLGGRFRYVNDPTTMELLETPTRMLDEIEARGFVQEDCESIATLEGALLEAVGIPTRFHIIERRPSRGYAHVWLDAWTGDDWLPLDLTLDVPPGGRAPAGSGREAVYPTEAPMIQLVPAGLGQDVATSSGYLPTEESTFTQVVTPAPGFDWSAVTGFVEQSAQNILPLLERYGVLTPQPGQPALPYPGETTAQYLARTSGITPYLPWLLVGGAVLLVVMMGGRRR